MNYKIYVVKKDDPLEAPYPVKKHRKTLVLGSLFDTCTKFTKQELNTAISELLEMEVTEEIVIRKG